MMIDAPAKNVTIPGHDGVRLNVWAFGDGPIDLIMAPGLGTPPITWKFVAKRFGRQFRIITWEPRGLFASGVPEDRDKLRVEDHTADLFAIARHFHVKKYVLGGWSMGVQISLEAYHQQPRGVRALLLINGAPGRVLASAYGGLPGFEQTTKILCRLGEKHGRDVTPVISWALSQPWTLPLLKRMQVFTENAEFLEEMIRPFATMDFGVYSRMMYLTNEHDASPYLPEVRVPTLITAGTKDLMTPVWLARRMAAAIPGAELFIVPNGTHYTVAEYPDIVNLRLERFFRDHLPDVGLA
jgi:pimeloyl-ACP methyl ester carboxylesterase